MPTPAATTITRLVFADQTSHIGTLFGGDALEAMASAAAISARRRAGCPVVLAATGPIDFRIPVQLRSIILASADVERVGRTSLTVAARLEAEDLLTGETGLASTGRFAFVAVNDAGRPTPVRDIESIPKPRRLTTTSAELVRSGQTNHHGTLFGGEMMRWLDAIAFIAATRHSRTTLVTARSDGIDFRTPIGVGDVLEFEAYVVETRRTSFVIEVQATVENFREPLARAAATARFVFAPQRQPPASR